MTAGLSETSRARYGRSEAWRQQFFSEQMSCSSGSLLSIGVFGYGLSQLARVSKLQLHYKEADRHLAELDTAIKAWDPKRREAFELNTVRVRRLHGNGSCNMTALMTTRWRE